ncbi:MAG: DUF1794 domain-containing protein [Balneola sp.]|nr:MAG: DUF1794 domain-containing protein [Balneola sp.]
MSTVEVLKNPIEPLTWVLGSWKGQGNGGFPTLSPFEYMDHIHFKVIEEAFETEPLIHFEEIAWVIESTRTTFKHWETGYFKPAPDGRIQLYICHNTGRIEITYGSYLELDLEKRSFELEFESNFIRNDEGTIATMASKRVLIYDGKKLKYNLEMSTSDVSSLSSHLTSVLKSVEEL